MSTYLSVTIYTASGRRRFSLALSWIGLFITLLVLGIGYQNFSQEQSRLQSDFATFAANSLQGSTYHSIDRFFKQYASKPSDLTPPMESIQALMDPITNPEDETQSLVDPAKKSLEANALSGMELKNLEAQINQVTSVETDPFTHPSPSFKEVLFRVIPNGSPVEFKGTTSSFGYRIHPTSKTRKFHPGIDLDVARKSMVKATADGVVEFSGFQSQGGYGNMVLLHHNHGFKTVYGHLFDVWVKNGDFVRKGDVVGRSGSTGRSSGPHLHYEVRFVQRLLNPTIFINWNEDNFRAPFKEKQVAWRSLIHQVNRLAFRDNESPMHLALR